MQESEIFNRTGSEEPKSSSITSVTATADPPRPTESKVQQNALSHDPYFTEDAIFTQAVETKETKTPSSRINTTAYIKSILLIDYLMPNQKDSENLSVGNKLIKKIQKKNPSAFIRVMHYNSEVGFTADQLEIFATANAIGNVKLYISGHGNTGVDTLQSLCLSAEVDSAKFAAHLAAGIGKYPQNKPLDISLIACSAAGVDEDLQPSFAESLHAKLAEQGVFSKLKGRYVEVQFHKDDAKKTTIEYSHVGKSKEKWSAFQKIKLTSDLRKLLISIEDFRIGMEVLLEEENRVNLGLFASRERFIEIQDRLVGLLTEFGDMPKEDAAPDAAWKVLQDEISSLTEESVTQKACMERCMQSHAKSIKKIDDWRAKLNAQLEADSNRIVKFLVKYNNYLNHSADNLVTNPSDVELEAFVAPQLEIFEAADKALKGHYIHKQPGSKIIYYVDTHGKQQMRFAYDAQNKSALLGASTYGHVHLVRRLLRSPEVQEQVADNDNAALFAAIENGHTPVVQVLTQCRRVIEKLAVAEEKRSEVARSMPFFQHSPFKPSANVGQQTMVVTAEFRPTLSSSSTTKPS